jgi:tRNA modification GTPase
MSSFAALMTAPGVGAIATIQVEGDTTQIVLEQIFRPTGAKPAEFETGRILLGHIVDGMESIDQVTVGCEGPGIFAIHCHGNPLIVEAIMKLLERQGVGLVAAERLFVASCSPDVIGREAKLALTTVKTLEGARLIANQVKAGLCEKVRQWQQQCELASLERLVADVQRVLHDSEPARLMIEGCTAALIGPAGAGKSTLLNTLAGREKAIVTGIKGTTRDWVSAEIHVSPLAVTVIDTAGLDADLTGAEGGVDEAAQARSMEILDRADVVLLVLDVSQSVSQLDEKLLAKLSAKKVVTVLNKADQPARLNATVLPLPCRESIRISAKTGSGLDDLTAAFRRTCGVADFDLHTSVAFTARQRRLLECLCRVSSRTDAGSIVSELLAGPLWA